MRLLKETVNTFLDSTQASKKYQAVISSKLLSNETRHLSPLIKLNDSSFRVARLGPFKLSFKKKDTIDLKGYLVLNEQGEIVKDKILLKEILPIYELWYYKYTHPTFSKLLHNYPYFLDLYAEFLTDLSKPMKERLVNGYDKEEREFGKNYAEILKQLDQQAVEHNTISIECTNKIKKFINLEKVFFEEVSESNFKTFLELISSIRLDKIKENSIWLKRKAIWSNYIDILKSIKKETPSKIDKELVESLALDMTSLAIPVPFLSTAYVFMKRGYNKSMKNVKKWYYEEVLQHRFGIKAIQNHINANLRLMDGLNMLNNIVETIDYSKVRY